MFEKKNLIKDYKDPISLFSAWFEEAKQKEINDPDAMSLSTISQKLLPSSRIVLLKSFDNGNFVFYTNTNSKKGISIQANPQVALNFHWKSLFRQIRIEGVASKVSDEEADAYFNSRPKESRIGAWASNQSEELKNREEFSKSVDKYNQKFTDDLVPRPTYWTGFRVKPNLIEFWQEMPFRLHDRVEYKKLKNDWLKRRLYP